MSEDMNPSIVPELLSLVLYQSSISLLGLSF